MLHLVQCISVSEKVPRRINKRIHGISFLRAGNSFRATGIYKVLISQAGFPFHQKQHCLVVTWKSLQEQGQRHNPYNGQVVSVYPNISVC